MSNHDGGFSFRIDRQGNPFMRAYDAEGNPVAFRQSYTGGLQALTQEEADALEADLDWHIQAQKESSAAHRNKQ